MNIESIMDP